MNVPVALPVSELVTVKVREPVVAFAATVTGTVREVALTYVTAPTVTPLPLMATDAPGWKRVPVIVTVPPPAAVGSAPGLTFVTVGRP